ncbi:MAG: nuclear transport factor 2 family protein [Gemmatimonadales bacterium]
MLRALTVACATFLIGVEPLQAQRAEDEVLAVVKAVFDGMRAKDTAKMRALFHPGAKLMSAGTTREGAPRVSVDSLSSWLRAVAGGPAEVLDERLHDTEVRVDGNLAMVWTGYEFYVGTRHNHCGVDLFVLAKTAEGWKITDVADTRRREGCKP